MFTSGQQTAQQEITIHDDNLEEPDETFTVEIKPVAQATYIDPALQQCEITILDDDCKLVYQRSWQGESALYTILPFHMDISCCTSVFSFSFFLGLVNNFVVFDVGFACTSHKSCGYVIVL